MKNKQKIQPMKVARVACQKCGEILAKLYPWALIEPSTFIGCGKCKNKVL